ncbi:MAG: tagaturonate epimerase family protein [Chloroflexi bacterium]|nr:tagaturonate epimerase family protein [Chloroflexota bacterium]
MAIDLNIPTYEASFVKADGTTYALTRPDTNGEKMLLVHGDTTGFEGTVQSEGPLLCRLSSANALTLRQRLAWLNSVTLGLQPSAGFGDRLGIATPGHIQAVQGTGVAPIFAQQSVRENTRIGRTPQQVMDDAIWGVFQAGWREAWGADADHLKRVEDIAAFVAAGYTFYTIDPGDYVDDDAETAGLAELQVKVDDLPSDELDTSLDDTRQRYLRAFTLDDRMLHFDEMILLKALAKYGAALAHTRQLTRELETALNGRPFELEMSVDETGTPTSLHEHFFIAAELQRLGVPFVSLAPRFVGRFEKGVDYIGDLSELEDNIAGHAAVMRYFGNGYKLSLHTGSDKFSVYPIVARHTGGRFHLKTAGTSYLEALRVISRLDTRFFREILELSRVRFEHDRKTYLISGKVENVPPTGSLSDDQLPDLLNQFDAREVLHVTFGSILDQHGKQLHQLLIQQEDAYFAGLHAHFVRHLEAFNMHLT